MVSSALSRVVVAAAIIATPLTAFGFGKSDPSKAERKPSADKAAAPVPATPSVKSEGAPPAIALPMMGLSVAVKKRASGIDYEDAETVGLPALRQQARTFIEYRRGQISARRKLALEEECIAKPTGNVFCGFLERKRAEVQKRDPNEERLSPFQIADEIARGKFSSLSQAREGDIHRALRLFPGFEPIRKAANNLIESKECYGSALYTGMGLKAEEFFPDTEFRELSRALYTRAADCSQDEGSMKARYRLSLLHIWESQCEKAEPLLALLSDQKGGDYVARSLYWRAQCARSRQDTALFEQNRDRLLKEYPLSYHGLMLSERFPRAVTKDPTLRFRSEENMAANPLIRAGEVLESLRAYDLAAELIESLLDRQDSLEPPVRLYLATVLGRVGSPIGQFKMLSGLFKDQPTTISRATLEVFYPLKRLDILKKYGSKVDPYLVAAVIRQESGWNERARSPAGALGLMQLMPRTARRMERVSKRELLDAKTNVRLGVRYFHGLLAKYEADAELALAAYNAGSEKVDAWVRRYQVTNRMLFLDLIPFRETREYVSLISRNYYWYLTLYTDSVEPASISIAPPTQAGKKGAPKGPSTDHKLKFTLFRTL